MRHESVVTAISWIPSEAITGLAAKLPFDVGVAHYDQPLPDVLDDLEALRLADRFRFANELRAYVEVSDGRITDAGYLGGGQIGSTTLRVGSRTSTFEAVAFPDLQAEPEVSAGSARFVQTAGGRTGVPLPRRVSRPPFVQLAAPTAWSTLALTISADGRAGFEVVGASTFPRHWIYDGEGKLAAKTGVINFEEWSKSAFGRHTPWGDEESPALVTAAETALERQLSRTIMAGGAKPRIRALAAGEVLVQQGEPGFELFLLLDGVLRVDVDGRELAEMGPGALVGERSVLEKGTRTATLTAVTACKVAVAGPDEVDLAKLAELSEGHRREDG